MTFHIETLGCKANQYDSQRLAEALCGAGLEQAPDGEAPDVWIINTCTVTHVSDRKCRQAIRRAVREYPGARIFVTGCYATASPEDLHQIEGLDGIYPRDRFDDLLEAVTGGRGRAGKAMRGDFGVSGFEGRARAMLKIQEGCDFFCNYCIVPHVRGEPRSMPLPELRREARRLARSGFREIVLTGIHLGLYGREFGEEVDLAAAVRTVAETDGVGRVRLSSLEAMEVTDGLLEVMQHPAVCPHLHLPLQSGDDRVLERMGRRYTTAEFRHAVRRIREELERPAITTDVMVGFPGETDPQFDNTLRFCREVGFSRMHVFSYSPRSGTPAAEMEGRVHSRVAKERSKRLRQLGQKMAHEWAEKFVGRRVRVLLEEEKDGMLTGYSDRYVRVRARAGEEDLEQIRSLRVTGTAGGGLEGEIVSGAPV